MPDIIETDETKGEETENSQKFEINGDSKEDVKKKWSEKLSNLKENNENEITKIKKKLKKDGNKFKIEGEIFFED